MLTIVSRSNIQRMLWIRKFSSSIQSYRLSEFIAKNELNRKKAVSWTGTKLSISFYINICMMKSMFHTSLNKNPCILVYYFINMHEQCVNESYYDSVMS